MLLFNKFFENDIKIWSHALVIMRLGDGQDFKL